MATPCPAAAFVTTTVGGAVGLALLPGAASAQAPKPGSKPTEQPLAFVSIAKDGTTTILCNRMDMGQGIETGLAMICAEELDADWSKVRTGFGDQKGEYVDPLFGMHLTGGSNSVKNSYQQYRELGARSKAMLLAAAAQSWGVPAASLKAENGVISGGGKSAGYGEFFDAAMKQPVPEAVTLKDPKSFKLIGQPTTLVVAKAKSTGAQAYGMDVQLPGMAVAVIQRPPVFNGKVGKLDSASEALKVKGVKAVLPVTLDRGGQGVAVVASGYWAAKKGRDALKVDWDLGWRRQARHRRPHQAIPGPGQDRPARRRPSLNSRPTCQRLGQGAEEDHGRLRLSLPQPRPDGAAGLHGGPEGRPLRPLLRGPDAGASTP